MTNSKTLNTVENIEFLQKSNARILRNLPVEKLIQETLSSGEGVLADNGALCIKTGKFTGRSPKDRFIVCDDITEHTVDWNDINMKFSPEDFSQLRAKLEDYLSALPKIYIQEGYACADSDYRLNVRLIAEKSWSAHFVRNMFLRPGAEELAGFEADWNILCAPTFKADPQVDHTRSSNFAIINFTEKTIIIGGTGYTGEIKKGIFSVLNFELPHKSGVLSMHCSANVGRQGDTAVFFGLSGTGKTTLSTDPHRALIGDDEHGWSDNGIFNFEGGCYAKTIDLSEEKEPEIFHAIKEGAILENIGFKDHSNTPDYTDATITQNTRVSYPIFHIENIQPGSMGGHAKNVFFLTCDAYGVLPPVSRLDKNQTMYHFISGYTAKVAGTEEGINEPEATFSACFGAPFMPLHPTKYAKMLAEKMDKHDTSVWLINTGWAGGSFPDTDRISLKYTRAIITAILNGDLDKVPYEKTDIFHLDIPASCPGVPAELLNPEKTWKSKEAYLQKANLLANLFVNNFKKFSEFATPELLAAAPQTNTSVVI